jgi:protein O-mannosyl-transferase
MAKRKATPVPTQPKSKPSHKLSSGWHYQWSPGFWSSHWIAMLIIATVAAIPYLQSLDYGYVLDDQIVITGNQFTKKGFSGIGDILSTESMTGYFGEQKDLVAGARYRPLSIVTFAVEHAIAPEKPALGHLGNIIFYMITCLLLYRVLLLWLPLRPDQQWWWSVPFVAVMLYALHPVHTEVVANIKGRDEIMTFTGALGAIWFSMKWLSDKRWHWLILSGFSFFLGLLSKENAITFLAVIPAGLYFFTRAERHDYVKILTPILTATVIYLLIRYQVIGYFLSSGKEITDLMNNPFVEMRPDQKMATIFYTLGLYLKLLVFPYVLTHDYYPYAIPIMNWTDWQVWLSVSAYAVMIGIFFRKYSKRALPAFSILFYLATISIVSNILFPVGTFMNERFLFISSAAYTMLIAWLLVDRLPYLLPKKGGLVLGLSLGALLLAGYMMRTYTRVPVWENAMTLNRAAIAVSPNSARANTFMTTALYKEYQQETDEAKKMEILAEMGVYIRKALSIYPAYYSGAQMYVGVLSEEYRYDNDLEKLLGGFRQVLERRDFLPYIDTYLEYLEGRPTVHARLSDYYYDLGYNLFWQQKRKKAYAIKYLEKGQALNPADSRFKTALDLVRQS